MICAICKLNYDETEMNFHHLIPKSFHNNKHILKQYDKEFLNKNGVMLCFACHNKLHSCIDEKDMAFEFNSIDKLLKIEDIYKWSKWKQKHPDFTSSYNRMTLKKRKK